MKEDSSEPPCWGSLQTAVSCFGRKVRVVNVMVKRRDNDHVRYGNLPTGHAVSDVQEA